MKSSLSIAAATAACVLSVSAPAFAQDPTALGPFGVLTAEYNNTDENAFTCIPATNCTIPGAEIRGYVHYPDNLAAGPFPLLIFLHGRHTACYDRTTGASTNLFWPCSDADSALGGTFIPIPSYRGYDYIARVLASHGYIVASIAANGINAQDNDVSPLAGIPDRAHLIDRHVQLWNTFDTTGSALYGGPFVGDFIGAVDLTRVGTMGHSRGGDGVVNHFALFGSSPTYTTRAVLPIAPTNVQQTVINNVNLGMLLGYCDGDVRFLPGMQFYDRARYNVPTDPTTKYTFLSRGSNHNYFNEAWTPECWTVSGSCWSDDRGTMPTATGDDFPGGFGAASTDPFCGPTVAGNGRLSPSEQRGVGLAYTAAFFRYHIGGELAFGPLLQGDVQPPAAPGSDTFVGYQPPPAQRIDLNRLTDEVDLGQTTLTGTGAVHGTVSGASLAVYDRCGYDTANRCFPGAYREIHLGNGTPGLSQLRTAWDAPTDTFVNNLPAGARDVSAFGVLQFRVAVDYTDTDNPTTASTEFSVRLSDGTTSAIVNTNSQLGNNDLFFPPGASTPGNARPSTVMNTLRLPLALFSGVNLANVESVTIQYDGTTNGTVLLSDIAFVGDPEDPAGGFPTPDPNDGKLLTVTGLGFSSITIPSMSLRIAVPAGETAFHVDIFDGDQAGHFDSASGDPTNTCFRLVSDPTGDGPTPGEEVINVQSDTFFADNAFTTLYTGAVHASAQNASGAHVYRLDVVTGPGAPTAGGDCPTPDGTKTIVQGFKVKSSAQVSIEYGDFSFLGADATGPFASPNPFIAAGADTSYNGLFDFYVSVPSMVVPTDLTFMDADADFKGDDVPGVADGASFDIHYLLFNGNGTLVDDNTDVSGNYDGITAFDQESNTVLTGGVSGLWRWRWAQVLTENNIHVWPPVASPPRLAVYSAPTERLRVTAAEPLEFWLDHPGQIRDFLPIRLGSGHKDLKVKDLDDALCILDTMRGDHGTRRHGSGGRCGCNRLCSRPDHDFGNHRTRFDHDGDRFHHSFGHSSGHGLGGFGDSHGFRHRHPSHDSLELLEDLTAQLLVAELNVALDGSRGQDLTLAFVYGRLETVADVLDQAIEIVTASLHRCEIRHDLKDDAELVLSLLEAINEGEVTFVSPTLEPPGPLSTPTLTTAARRTSGGAGGL